MLIEFARFLQNNEDAFFASLNQHDLTEVTVAKKEKTKTAKPTRKNVRFKPDPLDYAWSDVRLPGKFAPQFVGLIVEESAKGCSLALLSRDELKVGQFCRVQVGKLPVLKAEVRWQTDLDAAVYRIGLLYLE
jgi:hypothetical protein